MDDEVKGEGNSYDFGARMYDNRLGKFLSLDAYSFKFAYQSPYIFVGNSPIVGIDVNGDSLYVLFYTSGNSRGDDMFKAAALTRQYDIEHSKGFNKNTDKVVLIGVSDVSTIKTEMENAVKQYSGKYGKTAEIGVWSHAGTDGPVGTVPCATDQLSLIDVNQMSLDGWSKINFNWSTNARAGFYGCNTGYDPPGDKKSFASEISGLQNFKDVSVFGQSTYSYPSQYTNYRDNGGREEGDYGLLRTKYKLVYPKNTLDRAPVLPPSLVQDGNILMKTYLVSGYKIKEDINFNEQHVALPMSYSKNGWRISKNFQKGDNK
jgi:RHS repeat-associated protein